MDVGNWRAFERITTADRLASMSCPRSRLLNSLTWASDVLDRFFIKSPFVWPHGSAGDRAQLLTAAGKNERHQPSAVRPTENKPSPFIMQRLDDLSSKKETWLPEDRFDFTRRNAVFEILEQIAFVPVEVIWIGNEIAQPRGGYFIGEELHVNSLL